MRHFERHKSIALSFVASFLSICYAVMFGGCTLLGLGIGLINDSKPVEVRLSDIDTIKQGSKIVVCLKKSQPSRN